MEIKAINFHKEKGKPIYLQIYEKLSQDILQGYLMKGDQLPSIRKCEELMNVSRTSVERAYEKLIEEGYIRAIPQKGYFVIVDDHGIQMRKEIMTSQITPNQPEILYDLRSQTIDSLSFDVALWKKYLKEALDDAKEIATYGDPQGELALRIALQQYAYSARGVLCHYQQILVGSSFQTLLYILCGLLEDTNMVVMDESGFYQAEIVFDDFGMEIYKIPSDKKGMHIQKLKESDAKLVYINSASQGKDHQPMTRRKREELLSWANEKKAYIIEDDHNGELRYRTHVTPAMQGFDQYNHVIYIGSFSKLLLPSMRISYMVLPQPLLKQYEKRKKNYAPTSSKIEQLALAHYIADGHLEHHVKKLKKRYLNKSEHMEELLREMMPDIKELLLEEVMLQFIIRFTHDYNVDKIIEAAGKQRILVQKNAQGDLVLSFASIPMEEMKQAIQRLASCVVSIRE